MFDKLVEVKRRYEEINQLLMDPTVINDNTRYRNLMKEYKNLTPLIEKFDQYTQAKENFEEAQMMLDEGGLEPDFKEMVQMQYEESKELLEVAYIATPHIAGYSADGKANATRMSLEALCRFFQLDARFEILPPSLPCMEFSSDEEEAFLQRYNPLRDSEWLKNAPEKFEWFRGNYPLRRE